MPSQPLKSTITETAVAVGAPNAKAVSVIGDFNGWDGTCYQMRSMGSSGIWELFIPQVKPGALYKYRITTRDGSKITKIDPMGRQFETPPSTATVVTESEYVWRDSAWLKARSESDALASPMSTYEVHVDRRPKANRVPAPYRW